MLQTANALVTDKSETQVCAIKVLLDTGSQQTFIMHRLVGELKLEPVREINMEIISFSSKKERVMKVKEYELNIKNMDSSSSKIIKCLCVPKVCPNIKGKSVKQELKKHDFIKTLKLADAGISPECSIHLLIGPYFYWDFVTGETKEALEKINLVAISSISPWLISRPMEFNQQENDKTVCLSATLMLKIECYEANNEKDLSENISKFWD